MMYSHLSTDEFDGITVEIARVDLESVDDLDDGPVLSITPAATATTPTFDGRRDDDMAQNAALQGSPASGNALVEGIELFHHLPRLVQLDLGLLAAPCSLPGRPSPQSP